MRNEPKFCVEPLPKISPTLKKIICFTANKKLAALVETDDDEQVSYCGDGTLRNWQQIPTSVDKHSARKVMSNSPYVGYLGERRQFVNKFPTAISYLCDWYFSTSGSLRF